MYACPHAWARVPAIYLIRASRCGFSCLPPDNGRAALDCRYIWHCNPWDVLPPPVARKAGEPLPRLFTLAGAGNASLPGGCFLLHCPRGRPRLPVRKHGALCCPDFPLRPGCRGAAAGRPAAFPLCYFTSIILPRGSILASIALARLRRLK